MTYAFAKYSLAPIRSSIFILIHPLLALLGRGSSRILSASPSYMTMVSAVFPTHLRRASSHLSARCVHSRGSVMIETNLRIIQPGRNLYILTRRAKIVGAHLSPDLLEKACGRLRYQHGMAAIVQSGEA